LIKPVGEICSTCHGPNTQNGPHAPTIEAHTHHAAGSPGSECVACHMPKIEQTIADVNVRSHTFKFITPAQSEAPKGPPPRIRRRGRNDLHYQLSGRVIKIVPKRTMPQAARGRSWSLLKSRRRG
jgi:hypothetical protein